VGVVATDTGVPPRTPPDIRIPNPLNPFKNIQKTTENNK